MTDDTKLTREIGKASADGLGLPKKKAKVSYPTYAAGKYGSPGYGGYYSRGYTADDDDWDRAAPTKRKGSPPQTAPHHTHTRSKGQMTEVTVSHIVAIDPPVKFGVGVEINKAIALDDLDMADLHRAIAAGIAQVCDRQRLTFSMELRDKVKAFARTLIDEGAYWSPDGSGFYKIIEQGAEPTQKDAPEVAPIDLGERVKAELGVGEVQLIGELAERFQVEPEDIERSTYDVDGLSLVAGIAGQNQSGELPLEEWSVERYE